MIKYNEIMSNATVDPEMKSRVMAAVSKAIREQPGGAVVTELKKEQNVIGAVFYVFSACFIISICAI